MTIDFEDAAASAAALIRAKQMDGERSPNERVLCRRLGVRLELVAPHVLRGGHAARYSGVGDRIVRRRGLPPWLDRWVIAHELGHRWRRQAGLPFEESEEGWCNAFAGALLVPGEPLFDRWKIGHDLWDLVEGYPTVAPTCLALRVGETRLAETVVVQGLCPRYVRADHEVTRELVTLAVEAARCGRAAKPGIAKAWKMPEVPRRAALVLEAAVHFD